MSVSSPRFSTLTSRLVNLPVDDVDTDQIIPARFLKTIKRDGLGSGLFSSWRSDEQFVLNRPETAGAQVLLAGDNFGCGSSREHAVWALLDFGFRAVISTGFADIFRGNALKNGLLVVELDESTVQRLRKAVEEDPATEVALDLESTMIKFPWGELGEFSIDRFARQCLLRGLDQIGYLLEQMTSIETYEQSVVDWVNTKPDSEEKGAPRPRR